MDVIPIDERADSTGIEPRMGFGLAVLVAVLAHLLVLGLASGVWLATAGGGMSPPRVGEGQLEEAVGVLLVDDPDPQTRNVALPQVATQASAAAPPSPAAQPSKESPPPQLRGLTLPEDAGPAQQDTVQKETEAPEAPAAEKADASDAQANPTDAKFDRVTAAARSGRRDAFVRSVIEALGKSRPKAQPVDAITVIEFVVSPDGKIERLRVVAPSGIGILDELAIDWIRGTQFTPPPPDSDLKSRTFRIAYQFG